MIWLIAGLLYGVMAAVGVMVGAMYTILLSTGSLVVDGRIVNAVPIKAIGNTTISNAFLMNLIHASIKESRELL